LSTTRNRTLLACCLFLKRQVSFFCWHWRFVHWWGRHVGSGSFINCTFDAPGFQVCEVGNLSVFFPFPALDVKTYLQLFSRVKFVNQVAFVVGKLKFYMVNKFKTPGTVFFLNNKFALAEFFADFLCFKFDINFLSIRSS
jgi:hypothetical protein